jgi:hypothetical protein
MVDFRNRVGKLNAIQPEFLSQGAPGATDCRVCAECAHPTFALANMPLTRRGDF